MLSFDAVNISGSLWRYDYFVSGFDFAANDALAIDFSGALYSGVQDPPPSVANWSTFVFQPDVIFGVPIDGEYDALALVNGASLSSPFSVQFTWLGVGAPDSQTFALNRFDAQGGFVGTLGSGVTAPVPEPGTLLLLGAGLLALRVRRSRTPRPR